MALRGAYCHDFIAVKFHPHAQQGLSSLAEAAADAASTGAPSAPRAAA